MIDKKEEEEALKEQIRKYEAYQKLVNLNYHLSLIFKRRNEIFLKKMKQPRNRWRFYDELDYEYRNLYEASKKLKMKFNKIRMQFNIPCIRSAKNRLMIPILSLESK